MRILHVVPTYVPAWRYGGPIKSVHGLCKALAANGHDVHVFTTNVDGAGSLDVPVSTPVDVDGVTVTYFECARLRRLYWSPPLGAALEREIAGFDVLHLHSIFLWPTAAAARIARRTGVPYIVAPRGMLVPDLVRKKSRWAKTAWIRLVERRNLTEAAALHFTSRIEAEAAAQFGFPFRSTWVVPNGLAPEELEIPDTPDAGQTAEPSEFLLFIGRVNWKKGLDRLIAALALVPGCHLLIVGNDEESYQPQLEALAAKTGVTDRVRFLGPVYGAQKTALLRRAKALVVPSYSENFGNVALEAMAASCPVIVTPEVGIADIVRAANAGLVVDGDPQTLGRAIREALADANALKALGENGRRAVLSGFTWSAIARDMERVYRAVVAARPAGLEARVA